MTKVQNSSKSPESVYEWLSLKWIPKFISNLNYKKVRKIASLRPLLDQPWTTNKITSNILKVVVHCYLPNAKINLWSNFNSEKFVKSETLLYSFAEVGIKGGEIFWNVSKFRLHACLSNGHSNLWSNFNYKKLLKRKLRHAFQLGLGLKVVKIAWNIMKVGVHACLSNGHPNLWSSFNS